jgi:hypothetical protein
MVPGWIKAQAEPSLHVRRLRLKSVRLTVKSMDIPPFDADITMGADGALQQAKLSDGKLRLDISPKDKAVRVGLEASNWKPPLGPALEFDDLALEAVFEGQQVAISNIEGKIGFAPVKGTARANWSSGAIRVEGDFSLTKGDLARLMGVFTRDFAATGTLTANGTYALQSATLENLFAEPRVDATFSIEQGTLNNVDLVRAIQSPSRDGMRGGTTRFNTLTGSLQAGGKNFSYRQLQLASGPMNANGTVDVSAGGDLSGRVNAELGSKTFIVARGTLSVTGNLKTPTLKP